MDRTIVYERQKGIVALWFFFLTIEHQTRRTQSKKVFCLINLRHIAIDFFRQRLLEVCIYFFLYIAVLRILETYRALVTKAEARLCAAEER